MHRSWNQCHAITIAIAINSCAPDCHELQWRLHWLYWLTDTALRTINVSVKRPGIAPITTLPLASVLHFSSNAHSDRQRNRFATTPAILIASMFNTTISLLYWHNFGHQIIVQCFICDANAATNSVDSIHWKNSIERNKTEANECIAKTALTHSQHRLSITSVTTCVGTTISINDGQYCQQYFWFGDSEYLRKVYLEK